MAEWRADCGSGMGMGFFPMPPTTADRLVPHNSYTHLAAAFPNPFKLPDPFELQKIPQQQIQHQKFQQKQQQQLLQQQLQQQQQLKNQQLEIMLFRHWQMQQHQLASTCRGVSIAIIHSFVSKSDNERADLESGFNHLIDNTIRYQASYHDKPWSSPHCWDLPSHVESWFDF